MVTSLSKFRTLYPQGGIVADLISIHDGQCIVRAVVMDQGVALGSGLASSVDVQIAEDKARDRALAALGIFADGSQPSNITQLPAPTVAKTEPATQDAATEAPSLPEAPPAPTNSYDETVQPGSDLVISEEPTTEEEEDLGPPIDEVREEPSAPPENKVSAATLALEDFNTSAAPVDLSDVIAQTDVYLTQLGWTNMQGREYLEKTYSKRSRQQLTDEELMSFLLYLENQL